MTGKGPTEQLSADTRRMNELFCGYFFGGCAQAKICKLRLQHGLHGSEKFGSPVVMHAIRYYGAYDQFTEIASG
ncbi:MAG: hypothetical protein AAFY56_12635 [Pseudomonadota bacterium]